MTPQKTGWLDRILSYLVLPGFCSLVFLWPLLIKKYQVYGGAGTEMVMSRAIKGQFNLSLLSGHLPLWNEWVETGKVFLLFGTVPLNFLTPLELLLDPSLNSKLTFALPTFVVCLLTFSFFVLLARYIGLPIWVGLAGGFTYLLASPVGMYIFSWVYSGIIVATPFMIAIILMYFRQPNNMLLVAYFGLAFIVTQGAYSPSLSMVLIYISFLTGIELARKLIFEPQIKSKQSLYLFGKHFFAFVLAPLFFFAWQLPLIQSFLKVPVRRMKGVDFSASEVLRHFFMQFESSVGLRIFIGMGLFLVLTRLILKFLNSFNSKNISNARLGVVPRWALPPLVLFIVWVLLFAFGIVSDYRAVSISIVSVLFVLLIFRYPSLRNPNLGGMQHWDFGIRKNWRFPLLCAGLYIALFQKIKMADEVLAPNVLDGMFLFFIFIGALWEPEKNGQDNNQKRLLKWLSGYFVVCLGLGWVIRDFLAIPMYEIFNYIWADSRDFFWFVPTLSILFMIGVFRFYQQSSAIIRDVKDRLILDISFSSIRKGKREEIAVFPDRDENLNAIDREGYGEEEKRIWSKIISAPKSKYLGSLAVIAVIVGIFLIPLVGFKFFASKGSTVENRMLRYLNNNEWQYFLNQESYYRPRMEYAKERAGGFLRGLGCRFHWGTTGSCAALGIMGASGYDLISDSFRELMERAILGSTKFVKKEFPNLVFYSLQSRRVYLKKYPEYSEFEKDEESLWQYYTQMRSLPLGKGVDPFYVELMRVGLLWPSHVVQAGAPNLDPERWVQDFKWWIRADFGEGKSKVINRVKIKPRKDLPQGLFKHSELLASNDGATWTFVSALNLEEIPDPNKPVEWHFVNDKAYRYYMLNILDGHSSGKFRSLAEMEWNGNEHNENSSSYKNYLAEAAKVEFSSSAGNFPPAGLWDGNPDTYWHVDKISSKWHVYGSLYRFKPKKSLQRYGILVPRKGQSLRDVSKLLTSLKREDLEQLYGRMGFSEEELRVRGVEFSYAKFEPNKQEFEIISNNEAYLIVFDSFHPDWRAINNGDRVPIEKGFLNFRAIQLKVGTNHVKIFFEPQYMVPAAGLSLLTMIMVVGFCGRALWRRDK
ncbi:discoidin domain-containing protein [Nitrospina sp. 32_T5]|uniref:discoidin domain-containing protein n=1 Tax=unclassified Nitrospina TaxID=2638683 RepID=UPI003F94699C